MHEIVIKVIKYNLGEASQSNFECLSCHSSLIAWICAWETVVVLYKLDISLQILNSETERVLIAMKVCIDKEFALAGRCIH